MISSRAVHGTYPSFGLVAVVFVLSVTILLGMSGSSHARTQNEDSIAGTSATSVVACSVFHVR
ncbi:MAG: hypothetical protein H6993_18880 [Pseudomonadales bacterium]|nr:hypothetical protein [Pseudomonadales bacterium]MCP5186039.1 hypothetical protein [Pseudomonadales bacterium]